jgi:hypothetical protein
VRKNVFAKFDVERAEEEESCVEEERFVEFLLFDKDEFSFICFESNSICPKISNRKLIALRGTLCGALKSKCVCAVSPSCGEVRGEALAEVGELSSVITSPPTEGTVGDVILPEEAAPNDVVLGGADVLFFDEVKSS